MAQEMSHKKFIVDRVCAEANLFIRNFHLESLYNKITHTERSIRLYILAWEPKKSKRCILSAIYILHFDFPSQHKERVYHEKFIACHCLQCK